MEIQYQDYFVTLMFNPTDTIVRFEHKETYRIYEQTFFERDFPIASGLGGIEFVSKLLSQALKQGSKDLTVSSFFESPQEITMEIIYTVPLFIKPIVLSFVLPASRKETGKTDVGMLQRKIKELSESIEPRVASLQSTMEKRLEALEGILPLVKELQERCGSTITLPGCIFAIPTNLTSIILIKNQTVLPDGRAFSAMMPGHHTSGQYNNSPINFTNMLMGHNHLGYTVTWNPAPDSFTFTNMKSISNLKYLKDCKEVTLSGCSEVTNYSVLGEMPWLTHLTIVSSRSWATNPQGHYNWMNGGNNPPLTDIKWIKNLTKLQSLVLIGCSSLSDITPLKELPNLRTLDIRETAVRNSDFLINPHLTITK